MLEQLVCWELGVAPFPPLELGFLSWLLPVPQESLSGAAHIFARCQQGPGCQLPFVGASQMMSHGTTSSASVLHTATPRLPRRDRGGTLSGGMLHSCC